MRQSTRVAKVKVTQDGWRCERCQHEWVPKRIDKLPTVCPRCKSPYWNRPRSAK